VESLFNVYQFKGFPHFNIKHKLSRDVGHSVALLQFAVYLYLVFSFTASQMAIQTLILHGLWLLFCFCSSYDKYTSSYVHYFVNNRGLIHFDQNSIGVFYFKSVCVPLWWLYCIKYQTIQKVKGCRICNSWLWSCRGCHTRVWACIFCDI